MNRQTAVVLVLAALSVVAVGLGAATLSSVENDGGGGGVPSGVGESAPGADIGTGEPTLVHALAVIAGIAVLGTYVYMMLDWRRVLYFAAILALLTVAALVLLQLGIGGETPQTQTAAETANGGGEGMTDGSGGEGTGDSSTVEGPTAVLVTLFGVIGVGLFIVFAFYSDPLDGIGRFREQTTQSTDDSSAEIGAIAGRAADRIDDATGDTATQNEVYRAYTEMIGHLDVSDPESTTPREFASTAVDAGMDPADVDDLTRLFEDVRYGGYDPTSDREQQAREILRRIERRYTTET